MVWVLSSLNASSLLLLVFARHDPHGLGCFLEHIARSACRGPREALLEYLAKLQQLLHRQLLFSELVDHGLQLGPLASRVSLALLSLEAAVSECKEASQNHHSNEDHSPANDGTTNGNAHDSTTSQVRAAQAADHAATDDPQGDTAARHGGVPLEKHRVDLDHQIVAESLELLHRHQEHSIKGCLHESQNLRGGLIEPLHAFGPLRWLPRPQIVELEGCGLGHDDLCDLLIDAHLRGQELELLPLRCVSSAPRGRLLLLHQWLLRLQHCRLCALAQ
mmetsp:Transcript_118898/g.331702  ORF Transcript_118898/g.331702 Transcript_118898/m.331702 type:complete len:276 (+) Transcript_118898:111-938(+)|eukprot:CAMPEP_0179093868 /NCGR_PEP_ID=MMETSP0796-20121207/43017_1 /TAXON_ID=73915 /ORGANISM="Pyrodinium bahamense, Strain pbaha01" /LENGTH=275 /DNA_ID=CAMNT_0020791523 /DNA_START=110 /DNA_END=937 /DNA_ORIENTATION=+